MTSRTVSPGDEILAHRLAAQRLSTAPFAAPHDVVRWFGAVQAQVPGVAKWSVGQRTAGATDASLERALAEGTIVRTHALRPTWHYVAREDLRWLLALTSPRVHVQMRFRHKWLELDAKTVARSQTAFTKALAGGTHRTRAELAPVLERARLPFDADRLGHLLLVAELDGVICSGAPRGKQHTYALVEERAPAATLDGDEALAELTRRYFRSHGPATAVDFRWWSSLTAADVKRGLAMVTPELERLEVDGRTYWMDRDVPAPRADAPAAHLLQEYDELLVGYTESRDHLRATDARVLEGMAFLQRTVLLDGEIAGHWKLGARAGEVALSPFKALRGAKRAAVDAACQRYRTFATS